MPPFRFRAQVALDVRRTREEAAERALAVARASLCAAEADLVAAEQALTEAFARAAERVRAAPLAEELAWYRNWIAGRQAAHHRCRRLLDARRTDVQRAQAAVFAARKERKALDTLKTRAWQAHQREETRSEQHELDLLGTMGYATRRLAAGGQK